MTEQERRAAFLREMLPYAQRWAAQYGIPASVLLGWMSSESNFGNAPSIFGVKGSGTAGTTALATHEVNPDGSISYITDNFATFNNPDEAFQHMIDLVSTAPRYADSWAKLQAGDWQGFLQGINADGYATDPNWATMVQSLAESVAGYIGEDPDTGVTLGTASETGEAATEPSAATDAQSQQEQILAGNVDTTRGGPKPANDAIIQGILSDIALGGKKKDNNQLAQELYGKNYYELSGQQMLEVDNAVNTQQTVSTYTMNDIEAMIAGTHPTISLTPEQGIRIFREGFNNNGQFAPGQAAAIEAELSAIERAAPETTLSFTNVRDLVAEGLMTPAEANEWIDTHEPDERMREMLKGLLSQTDGYSDTQIKQLVAADLMDPAEATALLSEKYADDPRLLALALSGLTEADEPIVSAEDPFGVGAPLGEEIANSARFDAAGNRIVDLPYGPVPTFADEPTQGALNLTGTDPRQEALNLMAPTDGMQGALDLAGANSLSLSPEHIGMLASLPKDDLQAALSALTGQDAGFTLPELNAILGTSIAGRGAIADPTSQLSTYSDAEQQQRVYDSLIERGYSPEEAMFRARAQVASTDVFEQMLPQERAGGMNAAQTAALDTIGGYELNADTDTFSVNTGLDSVTGEQTTRELSQSEAAARANQQLYADPEATANRRARNLDRASRSGWTIQGNTIIDPQGNISVPPPGMTAEEWLAILMGREREQQGMRANADPYAPDGTYVGRPGDRWGAGSAYQSPMDTNTRSPSASTDVIFDGAGARTSNNAWDWDWGYQEPVPEAPAPMPVPDMSPRPRPAISERNNELLTAMGA